MMKFTYAGGSSPLDGYTIKRGIGRGGFGEVYYATSDAGKEVALKLIRRNLDVELRGVRHCLNLKHPHLIQIYDIRNDAGGDCWIVMEYVSGQSLENVIEDHPQGMPAEEALRWFQGVVQAVGYLHDHGIVHRDLKPGNIFSDEGIVKIGDYGLSKFISCSRRSGQTESVGTVHYMAPEIANGRYGREIDIYALGIVLFEMLTGRVPFEGQSVGEVLMKHLTAEPDLSLLCEPYRSVVAQALAKDPDARLGNVGQFLTRLPAAPQSALIQPVMATAWRSDRQAGRAEPPPVATGSSSPDNAGTSDEPLYAALRSAWQVLDTRWRAAPLPPVVKALLLLGAIWAALSTVRWWAPTAGLLLVTYSIYWLARSLLGYRSGRHLVKATVFRRSRTRPKSADGSPVGPSVPVQTAVAEPKSAPRMVRRKVRWDREGREALAAKGFRQRFAELCGSLMASAAVAAIVSFVAMLMTQSMKTEHFVWLSLVGTLGCWGILIPSKIWEGGPEDPALRRFILLVAGLATGAAAAGLADALLVDLPHDVSFTQRDLAVSKRFQHAYAADGKPALLAYVAYFGFLFSVLRWWRQADPLRANRISLWTTAGCVFWAWLLSQFWFFPQPWGLIVAAIVSIALQISSPWVNVEQRLADSRQQA
jgi:hypothetical protein